MYSRYYFVLEYGECVARRCLRLYEPPDVAGYFESCVWPEHLKYRAEVRIAHTLTPHSTHQTPQEDT